jgi:hypothetical protein
MTGGKKRVRIFLDKRIEEHFIDLLPAIKADQVYSTWFRLSSMAATCEDGGKVWPAPGKAYTLENLAVSLKRDPEQVRETVNLLQEWGVIRWVPGECLLVVGFEDEGKTIDKIREQTRIRQARWKKRHKWNK